MYVAMLTKTTSRKAMNLSRIGRRLVRSTAAMISIIHSRKAMYFEVLRSKH
jgi:hypothetical protein